MYNVHLMSDLVVVWLPGSDQIHHVMWLSTLTSDFTPKMIGTSRCWILGGNYTKRSFVPWSMMLPLTHKITERTIYLRFDTFIATHTIQYLTLGSYLSQIYCNVWCFTVCSISYVCLPTLVPWHRLCILSTKTFVVFFCVPQIQWSISAYDFSKCRWIHMNSWFILYQWAKVALKLVQKLGHDKQSKMLLKFVIFLPLIPPIYIFNF